MRKKQHTIAIYFNDLGEEQKFRELWYKARIKAFSRKETNTDMLSKALSLYISYDDTMNYKEENKHEKQ